MKKTTLIVTGALALMASACGRMADLEAPMPRQTERATRDRHSPAPPEPATLNRPSSVVGIDGGPSNPIGGTAAQSGPR